LNPLIFDSSALLSYFFGEEGATEVQKLLKTAVHEEAPLLLSPVNLGEIFYIVSRKEGAEKAESVVQMLDEFFFEMPPVDVETSLLAAKLKASHGLGYADAFAAALALGRKGDLVTGDKEFKAIEKELTIHWI
jgi:uncharacterized protein